MRLNVLLIALASWALQQDHVCRAEDAEYQNQILFFLYQQYWVANPISGQNFPPAEVKAAKEFLGIPDIKITSTLWVEYIRVLEGSHSFQARYWWALNYPDHRTERLIAETNASDTCAQLCSTHATLVTNMYGDDACCTAVYMPNSYFQNIVGGSLQDQPNEWIVYAVPGTEDRVQYWARGTSTFSSTFSYGAFPFDKQRLQFRIMTEYLPQLDGDDSLQLQGPSALIPALASFRQDASAFRDFKIHGWKVLGKSARITAFKQRDYFQAAEGGNGSLTAGEDRLQPGVIFSIEIQRTTTTFWIVVLVLPILLLILFSFFSFYISDTDIKTRMGVMSGMFLAILLLQFTVRAYLPGNQALIPPYTILVVSYVYLLAMALVFLLCYTLRQYYTTNTRKIKVLQATKRRIAFQRDQLRTLLMQRSLAKNLTRMPTQDAKTSVAFSIWETDRAVANIDDRIDALRRPWHEAKSTGTRGKMFHLLLTQRLTRYPIVDSLQQGIVKDW